MPTFFIIDARQLGRKARTDRRDLGRGSDQPVLRRSDQELPFGPGVDVRQLPVAETALQRRHGRRIARPSHVGPRVDILGRMADEPGRTLRFVPDAPRVAPDDGSVTVVLDSTWTATGELAGNDRVIGIRGVGGRLLEERDLIAETAERLDAWASASGIVDKLVVEGTSMWFYLRLSVWVWFQQRILWTALVDDLVGTVAPSRIVCKPGTDDVVIEAARLIAARDGLEIEAPDIPEVDRSGHAAPLPVPARRSALGRRADGSCPVRSSGSRQGPPDWSRAGPAQRARLRRRRRASRDAGER